MRTKSILLGLASAFAVIACNKAEVPAPAPAPVQGAPVFTATVAPSISKTELVGSQFSFNAGDEILIVDANSNQAVYAADAAGTSVSFSYKSGTIESGSSYVAYYPAELAVFPAQQTAAESTNASSPMRAESSNTTLEFKNVGALAQIKLLSSNTVTVTGIELSCETKLLSGTYEMSGDAAVIAEGGQNFVNANFASPISLGNLTRVVYVAIPEGEYPSLKIKIIAEEGAQTFTSKNPIAFAANSIASIGPLPVNKILPAVDLSANGTANCYIVPQAGAYKFKATVKGNDEEQTIAPASVEYLWSTFNTTTAPATANDIISDISFDATSGYVSFNATGTKGNVVVAAKDAQGTILWSWHLWCTEVNEVAHNKNNMNGHIMADRNLGALSNTYSAENTVDFGLFYEWGRKDPFVCAAGVRTISDPANTPYAAVHGVQRTTVASTDSGVNVGGTSVAYAVAHPTAYITRDTSPYDWNVTTNNNLWKANSKTMYDPCPVGYRVPKVSAGPWGYFTANTTWDSTYRGRYFTNADNIVVWHPAPGAFSAFTGLYFNSNNTLGTSGRYWGSDTEGNYGCTWIELANECQIANPQYRACGQPVRCQKITQ